MKCRAISAWLGLITALFSASPAASGDVPNLEETTCGMFIERFAFWLWSSAAGPPDGNRIAHVDSVRDVSFTAMDGRSLRGYKFSSPVAAAPKGYLLVAQGNAMLADQIIDAFASVANLGYDVYIFDYRGYGRSEGKSRLKAILSDYREIIAHLDAQGYKNRAFYGMSFGGIVLLDALKDDAFDKRVIIDSTPSALSDYGCPGDHDPVVNVEMLSGDSLFLFGEKDSVIPRAQSYELSERARKSGGDVIISGKFGHPFMDGYTGERMALIRAFLVKHETD